MPAEDESSLAVVNEKPLDDFAPQLTIRGPDGKRFLVATDSASNRARMQITVGRMAALIDAALDDAERAAKAGAPLGGLELQRLATATATFMGMSLDAYESKRGAFRKGNDLATLAIGMTRAMAEGHAAAAINGFDSRMKKIMEVGKVGPRETGGRQAQHGERAKERDDIIEAIVAPPVDK